MQGGLMAKTKGPVSKRLRWDQTVPMPGNPVYSKRVDQMRKNGPGYQPTQVGSPIVADNAELVFADYPPETLFVLDGGHRRALAEEDGQLEGEFIAELWRGLTRAEMYRRRRGANDRRTVKPAERFIEMAAEGDAKKRSLMATVERLGWRISYDREEGGLSCTNELEWIYERDHTALVLALGTYEAVWGMQDYRAQARAIKALGAFWLTYTDSTPPARLERLTAKLQQAKYTPDTLYAAGVNERHHLSFISTPLEGIIYVLVALYNHKTPKPQRIPGRYT
jgi:hypothetical protein